MSLDTCFTACDGGQKPLLDCCGFETRVDLVCILGLLEPAAALAKV